jgi:hypothetical protein
MKTKASLFSFIFLVFIFQIFLVPSADAANKIMPLGASLTRGIPGSSDDTGYRRSLYFSLFDGGYSPDFVGNLNDGIPDDFDRDHEGHGGFTSAQIAADVLVWLTDNPDDIVLLHIGTNSLTANPDDVKAILDEIDDFSPNVWVVLARIIDRNCSTDPTPCSESATTMAFNDNVEDMALDRINNPGNPAYPDKIVIVDMEAGADIDYRLQPVGDMWDNLHPVETGYDKMADLWFTGLMSIMSQANAGDAQTVKEAATATLDGAGSTDPDGTIVSYLWEEVTTSGVTINNDTTTPTATFTAPDVTAAGEILTFRLTVTDDDGLESTDTVSIDVINTVKPVANAGPDQDVKEGDPVTLDGTGSTDPDGTIVSYLWEQVPVPTVTITNAATAMAAFTAPDVTAAGEILTFRLTVTDDDGLESADTVNIAVTILPQADAGPDQNVDEFDSVTLDASESVTAGALSYQWTQTAGTVVMLSGASSATATFTAPDGTAAGEILTFQLTVTDDDGLQSTDTVRIEVSLKDSCLNDPNKIEPGICGCGVADIDTDGDGTFDCADTNDDNDGVSDVVEQGPGGNDPNYDGNDDGIADRLQNNVTSLHTYDDRSYVTIESPVGTSISNCKAVENPSTTNSPSSIEFPNGFFEFTITGVGNGGATTVILHFPVGTTFDTYYKYGPTPSNGIDHWYEFLNDGQTGLETNGNVQTLYFVDGKRGDDDLTADGIVIDLGGPAVSSNPGGGDGGGGGGGGGCFIGTAANSLEW